MLLFDFGKSLSMHRHVSWYPQWHQPAIANRHLNSHSPCGGDEQPPQRPLTINKKAWIKAKSTLIAGRLLANKWCIHATASRLSRTALPPHTQSTMVPPGQDATPRRACATSTSGILVISELLLMMPIHRGKGRCDSPVAGCEARCTAVGPLHSVVTG